MRERAKILIVDDEPFNVDYLEQELEDFGYDTVSARNGQEALDKVAAEHPDLILLDVMMPLLDGFTVCRMLKEHDDTRLIPIVMMTALESVEDRIRGIEAGADDFLTKPVDDRELRARLHTTLRLKATVDRKLGELQRMKEHFARFVPEAVKRLVAANPDAPELAKRACDVTVLFLDISGYTRLSERLPAERLNALVERYFSTFLDCIHAAGGDINETAGDGFMAIFQDALHASRAADTALALLAATEALNTENAVQPLTVHMGLNSGTALVGSSRFEGLRGTRWTFTASGTVTNLAARLAGLAQPGQILIGQETAHRLGAPYQLQRLGQEQLKNVDTLVEVYCLYGPIKPLAG
ncbi:MAG: response regulator [Candidatus Tectomicrobia bacterium]|uniref:Response regulator n=1 Tax=Tectimicrobiota bacterium TaxID=2528274 RepID=A0A937W1P5_UNCTE|nr:response regulator [Candidatus Tectomicrobia bacterium]